MAEYRSRSLCRFLKAKMSPVSMLRSARIPFKNHNLMAEWDVLQTNNFTGRKSSLTADLNSSQCPHR